MNKIVEAYNETFMYGSEEAEATKVDETLDQRGSRYGVYTNLAAIAQALKDVMRDSPNWCILEDDLKEALELTASKIARILNGDPDYPDNVIDIMGYMQLVLDRMTGRGPRGVSE